MLFHILPEIFHLRINAGFFTISLYHRVNPAIISPGTESSHTGRTAETGHKGHSDIFIDALFRQNLRISAGFNIGFLQFVFQICVSGGNFVFKAGSQRQLFEFVGQLVGKIA